MIIDRLKRFHLFSSFGENLENQNVRKIAVFLTFCHKTGCFSDKVSEC